MQCPRILHLVWLALLLILLLTSPANATKRTVVLVADLSTSKVSQEDAATISDLLRGELARERKFILVQRSEMETVAREFEFQMSGCTDQGCAVQLGQMLSAEKVVVGRVAQLFGRLTISAQVVDMALNDIEVAAEVDSPASYDEVRQAVSELAAKLSRHLPMLARVSAGRKDGQLFIDAGTREGLHVGQQFPVLRLVVEKDRDGVPMMEKRLQVGVFKATYVGERTSEGRRVTGEIQDGDYAELSAHPNTDAPPLQSADGSPSGTRRSRGDIRDASNQGPMKWVPSAKIPTKGLVALLPFTGDARDESGNGNDGRVYGAMSAEDRQGVENAAYRFMARGQNILVKGKSLPPQNHPLTISLWYRTSSSEVMTAFQYGDYSNSRSFGFTFNSSYRSGTCGFMGVNNDIYVTNNKCNDGKWHMITLTYSSEQGFVRLYIDGSEVGTKNATISLSGHDVSIGADSRGEFPFFGYLDDVAIYDRVLSADEVKALHAAGSY